MPTLDVVLHTNGGRFRAGAEQVLTVFPPVIDRVDVGAGIWVGLLDNQLARAVMDTCEPQVLGVPKPVRQYAQFYSYVRDLGDNAELPRWDDDRKLQGCVALSRLIHPTTVGFRYSARVRYDSSPESITVVPATIRGVPVDIFLSPTHERDWLAKTEVELLAEVHTSVGSRVAATFPRRIPRALWYFDYAQRTYYADLRWTLVATALEALVHTGKKRTTQHFKARVPALADAVGAQALSQSDAGLAYEYRSRLSHGDGFLSDMPAVDIRLYENLEEVLRLTILKAFREPAFAAVFTDDATIAKRFPV